MKKILIVPLVLIFILAITEVSWAEKIYYKNGKVISAPVLYRSKQSVWVGHQLGAVGIGIEEIAKIENDDGSISKYDIKSLVKNVDDCLANEEYDCALNSCNVLLKLYPDNNRLRYLRGLLNQKIGNSKGAIEDYDFLIARKVADANIFNNLGVIYAASKDYKKAQEMLFQALREKPDMVEIHENLAEIFMQTQNYPSAIEQYKEILQIVPGDQQVLHNLGLAYIKTGNFAQAKEEWEKILAISPEDKDAQDAIAYIKSKM